MRTILGTLAAALAFILIAGAVFVFFGFYDISATAPHSPITSWIIDATRFRSIKMTGIPAWRDHSDEELWAIVAFLEKLPGMSEPDYASS